MELATIPEQRLLIREEERLARLERWRAQLQHTIAASFDIETTHLYADFGHILVAAIKPWGQKPIVLRLDEYWAIPTNNDAPLVADLVAILSCCPLVYGWNIDRYDIPYVRTRKLIAQAEGWLPRSMPIAHFKSYDMMKFKRKLRMHNNRLETWMTSLTDTKKTPVRPRQWRDAQFFDKKSMDYVVDHCIKDVIGAERVFQLLWSTMHNARTTEVTL